MKRVILSAGRSPICLPVSVIEAKLTTNVSVVKSKQHKRFDGLMVRLRHAVIPGAGQFSAAFAGIRIAHIGRNRFYLKEEVLIMLLLNLHINILFSGDKKSRNIMA